MQHLRRPGPAAERRLLQHRCVGGHVRGAGQQGLPGLPRAYLGLRVLAVRVAGLGAGAAPPRPSLEDARFIASDFNNGIFRDATLSAASFEDCKLTGADFSGARALGARFTRTLLVSARLPGFDFRKERLAGVDLSSADLANCDFRETVFEGSSLREANIEGARFEHADLRGADLGGLDILGRSGRFRGAVVSAAQAEMILAQTGIRVRAR